MRELTNLTENEVRKLDWVERRVPLLLGAAGVTLVVVGAIGARRRRREPRAHHVDARI